MQQIKINESNLESGKFENGNFRHVNITGSDCSYGRFWCSSMVGVIAQNVNFSYADLRDVDLRGADLRGANFAHADLSGADLYGANIDGANFSRASLKDAIIQKRK